MPAHVWHPLCALSCSLHFVRPTLQGRERRHSSPEAELDLDPNALLETDALGLSKAEKEAEEEARRLEESR